MRVYIVHHTHDLGDEAEDIKIIGIYSSQTKAYEAVRRLSSSAGFQDHADGFSVSEYIVDQDNWIEGFVSYKSNGI